jgi:predicted phage terminase large subunit-like protein
MSLDLLERVTLADVRAEWAERALARFLPAAWPVLEPSTPFRPNWHLDYLCEVLEAVALGQIRRLVINVPPRSLKSTLVTIDFPVWLWIRRPALRWLFASYSQDLSEDHSVKRRTLIQSDWYQRYWGTRYRLADDQNQKREFRNDRQGVMTATSMLGTATGKGGDFIVIDDPHNPKQAESDAERHSTLQAFDLTFSTRLNDPKTGVIIVVMQRLHTQDLTGHVLARGGWTHVKLPMRAEDPERTVFPISGQVHERAPGDLLHPDRIGPAEAASLEHGLGPYGAAGQLQQEPAPSEGGVLKRQWWRFWYPADGPVPPVEQIRLLDGSLHTYIQEPLPPQFETMQQTWDLAFKDLNTSDYVAGEVQAKAGANVYTMADEVYEHLDIWATLDAIRGVSARWPQALAKYIEDKANGPAVITMLRRELPGLLPVEPEGGKMARVQACVPIVAAGNAYLPHPALHPWVRRFINNCALFPNGAHDDDVDRWTQGVIRLFLLNEWTSA